MSSLQENIKRIQDKFQSLLKNYVQLQKENERLKNDVTSLKEKENNYKTQLDNINQKVNILQVAAGQMNDSDKKAFEKRIGQYIKDIDKSISLLSE